MEDLYVIEQRELTSEDRIRQTSWTLSNRSNGIGLLPSPLAYAAATMKSYSC